MARDFERRLARAETAAHALGGGDAQAGRRRCSLRALVAVCDIVRERLVAMRIDPERYTADFVPRKNSVRLPPPPMRAVPGCPASRLARLPLLRRAVAPRQARGRSSSPQGAPGQCRRPPPALGASTDGAPLARHPRPMRAPRSPPEPAGVQNLLPSKQSVLRVNDKHQAATAGATVRVGVIESLTRQALAAGTAELALALIDPDFDPVGPNIGHLDLPRSAFKVSSQSLLPQELLTAHRTRPPRPV